MMISMMTLASQKKHLGGFRHTVKTVVEETLKPLQAKLESIEAKMKEATKEEKTDVSKLLEPLKDKVDDISDKGEDVGSSNAGLKKKVDEIKDSIEDATESTKDVKGKVDNIKKTVSQTQKDAAGLKEGVTAAVTDLKKLSGSIEKNLGDVATKDDVKKVVGNVKEGIKGQLEEAAKDMKGKVEEALKKSGGTHKDIGKTVKKNQKYLKRIYKDLHFHPR